MGNSPKMICLKETGNCENCRKCGDDREKCGIMEIQAYSGKGRSFSFCNFPDPPVEGFTNLIEVPVVFLGEILALGPERTAVEFPCLGH